MCQLDDIEYWSDYTVMYDVDDDGEPVSQVDDTGGDFRCYHCRSCGEEFDTFDEVKEHLDG